MTGWMIELWVQRRLLCCLF